MGGGSSKENDGKDPNDTDHPDNKTLKGEPWQEDGDIRQKKDRSCTDFLCVILIICAWMAMTLIGMIVLGVVEDDKLKAGNPERLISAIDYDGNICGYTPGFEKLKLGYYLPDTTALCIKECPLEADYERFYCKYEVQKEVDEANDAGVTGYNYMAANACMPYLKTKEMLNRCVIDQIASALASHTNSSSYGPDDNNAWFSTFMGDIYNNKGLIFGFGICVSTIIAFTYLYVLRIPGLLMIVIWSIIFSIEALALAGAFMLMELAKDWKLDGRTDNEVKGMEILSYIVLFLAFLYACLMVVLRKRVQLAISVVKQAARSLASMPILIFMPVFQTFFLCIFLLPWCLYVLYLASSGDISNATGSYVTGVGTSVEYQYREFTFDQNTKFAFIYMLFIYFWTSEFIVAIGQLIIALSIVAWYFNRDKKTVNNKTAIWSAKTITRYHLGTAAFGSLIIAIIKTIRAIIAYFQKKAKKSGNKLAQYVLCLLQCCMWCLEKFMKFLNKNAYIQTAIYGQSFCPAAKRAFFLLLRNVLRVAAVTMVSTFILLLGKVFVPVGTTFICYCMLAYDAGSSMISDIVSILIFVFILSWFISSMFSEIFGMTIETILCCYIADEEMFEPEKRFADGDLKSSLQKTAQAAADNKVVPREIAYHGKENDEIVDISKGKHDDGPVLL